LNTLDFPYSSMDLILPLFREYERPLLWECMGILWSFLIVISMTRTTAFSKTTFADFGATLRMCLANALVAVPVPAIFQD